MSFREVRRGVALAGVVSCLTVGPALAASNISYILEVGGDNHAAAYKAGTPQLYTSGTTEDGVTLGGPVINWAIRVAVSGVQENGNGAGQPVMGAANLVCDLELRSGSADGPLVTGAQFFSSINDGNDGDVLAAAAFAISFDLIGIGPGRVVDPLSGVPAGTLRSGPLMGGTDNSPDRLKSATYPTAAPGRLIGMGCGYNAWKACCGAAQTTPGVGIVTYGNSSGNPSRNGQPGLGVRPIFEGQINMAGLPLGTYVLKVIPADGNNVLRGDINLGVDQNAFATAADTTTGDTITFILGTVIPKATNPSPANGATNVPGSPAPTLTWTGGAGATIHKVHFGTTNPPPFVGDQETTSFTPGAPLAPNTTYYWRIDESDGSATTVGDVWSFTTASEPLQIVAWRSVRSTSCGNQAITLDPSGVTTEPRLGGLRRIEVEFNRPIIPIDNPILSGSDGSFPMFIDGDASGTLLWLEYPPLANGVCYTLDLATVVIAEDDGSQLSGSTACTIRNLYGDVNNNGVVNLGDALLIKAKVGQAVSASTAAFDLDLSCGNIELSDALAAKAAIGASATCAP